ncbi:MAG: anthranilate phosphoribosyltransferase [Methanosarcinales archaeon]|nr:anthranilate phosphoribosyltransferase [ANME-2 cluster archaeon]MDF1530694.1 anthranilate phosphoribosyltransferase [ANME-2 cluster archaeon]MDW7774780.1 anthranilate phosphoribosyltransferase [Methanosarcinales archaeon]
MQEFIQKITSGHDLSSEEAESAIGSIFADATDAQIGAFLIALKMKGESAREIAGLAKGMKKAANTIKPKISGTLVDTCGTGGDSSHTINVSTASAIVTSAAGVPVAKHGNYSITSKSGSADVLKELGVSIDLPPEKVEQSIEKAGIGFMLAPIFHPSMKRVGGPRKELGVRTVFNILGPLTNPANARAQVIGVFDESLCITMANVLNLLGTKRAFVVHGSGLDEISNLGQTTVAELNGGNVESYSLTPEELGIPRASIHDITGGTPQENAADIVKILKGKKGAKRDIVVMNSAAALVVGEKASDLKDGIELAQQTIDNGSALEKLRNFVNIAGVADQLNKYL